MGRRFGAWIGQILSGKSDSTGPSYWDQMQWQNPRREWRDDPFYSQMESEREWADFRSANRRQQCWCDDPNCRR